MRPFGHIESREGRDAATDARLQDAWAYYLEHRQSSIDRDLALMQRLVEPIRPSKTAIEQLIIMNHDLTTDDPLRRRWADLGPFATAAYQLLPEEEIIYTLDTPRLYHLGYELREKHLIIDGRVGDGAGYSMFGALTINGEVGPDAGERMIGRLTNNCRAGYGFGERMIGFLENNGRVDTFGYPDVELFGPFDEAMIGKCGSEWNIKEPFVEKVRRFIGRAKPGNTRERFTHDIAHLPKGASIKAYHNLLSMTYKKVYP
jgi:hypothetical protein